MTRIGIGYDIHRFEAGRRLVLGGVEFEGETGLVGHSDADVLVHAVIDAVLGAAALGDMGLHFPPDNPAYAGADSIELLRHATSLVRDTGYEVESVDSTVIAERPRLSEHIPAMRARMAAALGVDTGRVNVKAKTSEGIGAVGRGEGIAALAVALLAEGEAGGRT
ncbi:MAG: 2-C-methyl-D-erythritol 2,4-cyclodiphosphate synthase [Dehalococcoidia bacterium]|nr:2-C-methyl-D-erythritol 2,4-cyclodiphosphate synthase [Dehalococcoidia bacterium]